MLSRILVTALLLCAAIVRPVLGASTEDLAEITRLHHAGQTAAALERADRALAANPKDAQVRFLKSVLLADSGRSAEARVILEQLVQDYPELAEPHNNLAAIDATNGEYGKARAELEEAIRLNPSYAPAHENLGDIHALLAGQAYAKALRLEPTSNTLPRKLALVRQLTTPLAEPRASSASTPRPAASAALPR
ncbi:MAG TPA: tetratricopeptide repeat protein [Caldimonas sp.]|jgi:Flp pilus assembly protein TadD